MKKKCSVSIGYIEDLILENICTVDERWISDPIWIMPWITHNVCRFKDYLTNFLFKIEGQERDSLL